MCGICGIVDSSGPIDREVLELMTRTLRHRGPDDERFFLSGPEGGAGPSVGLGFRRLAIIDLAGGNQPMWNEDRSLVLVQNGEIYNFRELRAELEASGHRFATAADTEVILHLYEEHGPGCVEHLNGMFAFAIWDRANERLFLARDRFGEKPLYYADLGGQFVFASELKALLQHPLCPRDVDMTALRQYLACEYVPSPLAIVEGVRKLPAGHRLVLEAGRIALERYWDMTFEPGPPRSEDEWVDEFRDRLREAVRLRLVSDVPLGAFLSGGIDSSSVVAFMADLVPRGNVKTFSIAFREPSFDESESARRVAQAFGTDHHEGVFSPRELLEVLPAVAAGLDEPFGDASVLPTYLLSRYTREAVTVALGGDGGDELLAGYPTFQADALARWYRLPPPVHRGVLALARRLPVSRKNFSLDFKIKRFLSGMAFPPDARHAAWLGSFTPAEVSRLLREPSVDDPYERQREVLAGCSAPDRLARLICLYAQTYLPDDILVKTDRASMLTSLEVRAPFLDHTLVEFLGRVPSSLKLRGVTTKVILKRAMGEKLPAGIARRPKKGFGIPLAAWFRNELREHLLDELSPERLERQGIFDPAAVASLVRDHLDGRRDNRKELWTLFAFQLWHRNYG